MTADASTTDVSIQRLFTEPTTQALFAAFPDEARERWLIEQCVFWRDRCVAAGQRRMPPARQEADKLRKEIDRLTECVRSREADAEVWKSVAGQISERLDQVLRDRVPPDMSRQIATLTRERNHWRERWRHVANRLAVALEHQGNVELLEDELQMIRQRPHTPYRDPMVYGVQPDGDY